MKSSILFARCCRAVWTVETLSLSFLAIDLNGLVEAKRCPG